MLPLNPLYEVVPFDKELPESTQIYTVICPGWQNVCRASYENGKWINRDFDINAWYERDITEYVTHYLRPLPPERMEEWVRDLVGRTAAYMRFKADMPSEYPDLTTFTDNLVKEVCK